MALPKVGEKGLRVELPEKFLNFFEKFEQEFRPIAYKKHVIGAAMLLYAELSKEQRLGAVERIKREYFDSANPYTHKVTAALKMFEQLDPEIQDKALQAAMLDALNETDSTQKPTDAEFAELLNQVRSGTNPQRKAAKRKNAKKKTS